MIFGLMGLGLLFTPFAMYSVIRWAVPFSLTLLIAGPLLLSTFTIGPLTLDNYASIVGAVIGVGAILAKLRDVDHTTVRLAIFPIAVALSIALTAINISIESTPAIIRYGSIAVLAGVVAVSSSTSTAIILLRAATALGATTVIVAQFVDVFTKYTDDQSGELRSGGLMGHPNFAAYVMCLVLLFLLLRRGGSRLAVAEIALLLVAILATGALTAALTAGGVWAASLLLKPSFRSFILAAVAAFAITAVGSVLSERIQSVTTSGQANSLNWRFRQWHNLIAQSADDRVFGFGWQQSFLYSGNGLAAHSAYVQTFVELGLAGSVILSVAFIGAFWTQRRSLVGMLLLAFILISSITDPVLLYPSCLSTLIVLLSIRGSVKAHPDGLPNHASKLVTK